MFNSLHVYQIIIIIIITIIIVMITIISLLSLLANPGFTFKGAQKVMSIHFFN